MENIPNYPKVSILVSTYNRAPILAKSLDSVLNQTYKNFELVIIDNGSTDETPKVLEAYQHDERVRIITLPTNLGCAGGYNYGIDLLRGEWFGLTCDDDLLTEDAIETLMRIPETLDPEVNAVSANSINKSNGELASGGVDKDQYLDFETVVTKCWGEFWGLTKLELLGDKRFNEELFGNESTVWFQIDAVAKRYYVNKVVQIIEDRGSTESNQNKKIDLVRKSQTYKALLKEDFYWQTIKKFRSKYYQNRCFKGWFFLSVNQDKKEAKKYADMFESSNPGFKLRLSKKLLGLFGNRGLKLAFQLIFLTRTASNNGRLFLSLPSNIRALPSRFQKKIRRSIA